jgi:hypothetical protein
VPAHARTHGNNRLHCHHRHVRIRGKIAPPKDLSAQALSDKSAPARNNHLHAVLQNAGQRREEPAQRSVSGPRQAQLWRVGALLPARYGAQLPAASGSQAAAARGSGGILRKIALLCVAGLRPLRCWRLLQPPKSRCWRPGRQRGGASGGARRGARPTRARRRRVGGHRVLNCMHSGIVKRNRFRGRRVLHFLSQALLPAQTVCCTRSENSLALESYVQQTAWPGSAWLSAARAVRGVNYGLLTRGGRRRHAAAAAAAAARARAHRSRRA